MTSILRWGFSRPRCLTRGSTAMGMGLLLRRFAGGRLRLFCVGLTALFAVMSCVVYAQVG